MESSCLNWWQFFPQMDESLENFLEERGIPAEKIEAMKDQKVGCFLSYFFILLC